MQFDLVRWMGIQPASAQREQLKGCFGAFVGIMACGFAALLVPGAPAELPLLIAPVAASAVLLFAAPHSPLTQPWPIFGGNVLSAAIGVNCAFWIRDPVIASAVALALSIFAMFNLRCLHPASGAIALTAILGGPAIAESGYLFVAFPVATSSLTLIATATLYNRLVGRSYPAVPARAAAARDGKTPSPAAA